MALGFSRARAASDVANARDAGPVELPCQSDGLQRGTRSHRFIEYHTGARIHTRDVGEEIVAVGMLESGPAGWLQPLGQMRPDISQPGARGESHPCLPRGGRVGPERPGHGIGLDLTTSGDRHEAPGCGVAKDTFELVGVGAGGRRQIPDGSR